MCDVSAGHCDRSHAASHGAVLLRDHPRLDVWAFTGAGSTSNTNGNVITLTRKGANHHVHGNWYLEAPSHIQYDYELQFNVSVGGTNKSVDPFRIRVEP